MATLTTNEKRVTQIANTFLFSSLSTIDLAYWKGQLDKGSYTPLSLSLLAAGTPTFQDKNLPLATMYYCAFGAFPSLDKMLAWKGMIDSGSSVSSIATSFLNSIEFTSKNPDTAASISAKLDFLITASGASVAADLKAYALTALTDNTISFGDALQYLANHSGKQTVVTLALLDTVVSGNVPTIDDISPLGTDITVAMNTLFANYAADAVNTYIGTSAANIFYATSAGSTVRGAGGNDEIHCNTGVDKITFETTAATNGEDMIYDFTRGTGKDVLNFANLLGATKATALSIAVKDSSLTTSAALLTNGAVLVVSGNALDTPTAVAALFGAGTVYAAPTTGGLKAVLITADVIGDAKIWHIVNQADVGNITSDEITLVGTLVGVNNFSLVPFVVGNFA
jgi:hypothetical protein